MKAKPTESPVNIKGVAVYITCPIPLLPPENPPKSIVIKAGKASLGLLIRSIISPSKSPIIIARKEENILINPSFSSILII